MPRQAVSKNSPRADQNMHIDVPSLVIAIMLYNGPEFIGSLKTNIFVGACNNELREAASNVLCMVCAHEGGVTFSPTTVGIPFTSMLSLTRTHIPGNGSSGESVVACSGRFTTSGSV